jgi:putative nucleotidyltransferase with HDIG domain
MCRVFVCADKRAGGTSVNCIDLAAERAGGLPELPPVAREALSLLAGPENGADAICDLLLLDEELTGRLRRMAASRLFGLRDPGIPLREVHVLLGAEGLRRALLAVVAQGVYRERGSRMCDLLVWEHSLAVAVASARLAENRADVHPGDVFLAGLIHDMGKSVLDENLPAEYERVLSRVYDENIPFVQAENELLGFDHSDVGALVCRKWGLAATVEEAVRLHHRPARAQVNTAACAIVSVANSLCRKLEIGPEWRPDIDPGSLDEARWLGLGGEDLAALGGDLLVALGGDQEALGIDYLPPSPGGLASDRGESPEPPAI